MMRSRSILQIAIVVALVSPMVAEYFSISAWMAAFDVLATSPEPSSEELLPHIALLNSASVMAIALAIVATAFTSIALKKLEFHDRWLIWVCVPVLLIWLTNASLWFFREAITQSLIYTILLIFIGSMMRASQIRTSNRTEQDAEPDL